MTVQQLIDELMKVENKDAEPAILIYNRGLSILSPKLYDMTVTRNERVVNIKLIRNNKPLES